MFYFVSSLSPFQLRKGGHRFEAMTEPNWFSLSITEQKYVIYKMENFRKLKNSENNYSFTDINSHEWAKKIFPQPSLWNIVFIHISSPQISSFIKSTKRIT